MNIPRLVRVYKEFSVLFMHPNTNEEIVQTYPKIEGSVRIRYHRTTIYSTVGLTDQSSLQDTLLLI